MPATRIVRKSWKLRQWPAELRVDVDDHPVRAGGRERDLLADPAVGGDRRMAVDDRREVVADDDQVHARVRAGAAAVVVERLSVRLRGS